MELLKTKIRKELQTHLGITIKSKTTEVEKAIVIIKTILNKKIDIYIETEMQNKLGSLFTNIEDVLSKVQSKFSIHYTYMTETYNMLDQRFLSYGEISTSFVKEHKDEIEYELQQADLLSSSGDRKTPDRTKGNKQKLISFMFSYFLSKILNENNEYRNHQEVLKAIENRWERQKKQFVYKHKDFYLEVYEVYEDYRSYGRDNDYKVTVKNHYEEGKPSALIRKFLREDNLADQITHAEINEFFNNEFFKEDNLLKSHKLNGTRAHDSFKEILRRVKPLVIENYQTDNFKRNAITNDYYYH